MLSSSTLSLFSLRKYNQRVVNEKFSNRWTSYQQNHNPVTNNIWLHKVWLSSNRSQHGSTLHSSLNSNRPDALHFSETLPSDRSSKICFMPSNTIKLWASSTIPYPYMHILALVFEQRSACKMHLPLGGSEKKKNIYSTPRTLQCPHLCSLARSIPITTYE